ncbi:MAG TPA: GAF and ANTAR domain-containing protein, partial [Pseudonocardiaceae bacterium]
HAAVSVVHQSGRIDTPAASDQIPLRVDAIQYEVDQGPGLDVIREHRSYVISDLAVEDRWPGFSRRVVRETGVRSMLALRLFVGEDTLGVLNLHSCDVAAFDEHGRAVGVILAAHVAVAMSSARDRERADTLTQAVGSNRQIGMAMGMLMAHGPLTQDQAFNTLRRASQHLNMRLREVAATVIETGQLPAPDGGPNRRP